jgi:hypothetical protein
MPTLPAPGRVSVRALSRLSIILLICILASLTGAGVVFYVSMTGGKPGLLLALPGAVLLGMLFLYSRITLFMLILLTRSVMDPIFDATKIGGFGLGAVVNALVILIALLEIFKRPNGVQKLISESWLPFLLISMLTLGMTPDFVSGLKTYLALVSYAAIFSLAIVLINSEEDYGKWMRVIFLSSIVPVIYGFVDAATGGYRAEGDFRVSSSFSHPNIFAFYLVLMISIGFYFFKSKVSYISPTLRRAIPFYLLLMLSLLLMTKTRSAWASCFAFFTLYAVLYERKYLLWIALSGLAALMVPEIRDRLLDLAQGNEVVNYSKLNSYAWRKQIWKEGLAWMSPARYFMGYGLESFKHYSMDFFSLAGGMERGAHSVYVQLLFETGVLGLGAFVWLHVRVGQLLFRFYAQNKLMIFSSIMFLLEFALDAYSDNMLNYLSFNWYLWFVLGAAYAVNRAKVASEAGKLV